MSLVSPTATWNLPAGWFSVLASAVADRRWRAVLPPAVDGSRLAADMDRFEEYVAAQSAHRGWLVCLPNNPDIDPMLIGVGWFDLGPGPRIDDLAERLQAGQHPQNLISRTVDEHDLSGDVAVVCHDLIGFQTESMGARLQERVFAARHFTEAGLNLMFEFNTSDMAAFEDMAATAAEVLAGLEIAMGDTDARAH